MVAKLSLSIQGDVEIERTLIRWHDNMEDLTPAWDNLNDYMAAIADQNFEAEGADQGERWAPITPAWEAFKAAHDLDPRILHATYRLRRSLAETNHPEHFYHATPYSMTISSLVPYFKYHQSRKARKHGERRPALAWNEETKHEAVNRIQEQIVKGKITRGDVL